MIEKTSRVGRPPRYSLDDVLDAAERLPFEQLTMTSLAKELGLVTSALYRYVRDRDDLIARLTTRLAPRLPLPDESLPWDEWMHETALGIYDLVVEHPIVADIRSWIALFPVAGRPMIEARDRVLEVAGLTPADAVTLHTAATNLALTLASSCIAMRGAVSDGDDGRHEQIDRELRATLADAVALLVDGSRRRLELHGTTDAREDTR